MSKAHIGYIYDQESIKLPITSVDAVFDNHGKTVRELIDDVQPISTVLVISTTAGLTLSSGVNSLSVKVLRANVDVTTECSANEFVWTREEDGWLREGETGKTIAIGEADLVKNKGTFVCKFKHVTQEETWEAAEHITIDGSLSDNISLIGWISSNHAATVKKNGGVFIPDWSQNPLVLTPVIKKAGNDSNLVATRAVSKDWFRRMTGQNWTRVVSGQNGETIANSTGVLTVSVNLLVDPFETCEYCFACKYYDDETDKTMNYEMVYCISRLSDGVDGQNGADGADGQNGADGQDGIGIRSITQTKRSIEDGGDNEWTLLKTDGTVDKFYVRNGSKGHDGIDGEDGWTKSVVRLYRRSKQQLTRDSLDFGQLTYDLATDSIIEAHNRQVGSWWTTTIAGVNSLWTTFAIVYTREDQVVLSVSDWSTPVILSEVGSSGQEGETIASLMLFMRSEEEPEKPANNIVFNFINHSITQPKDSHGDDLPWALDMPDNNGDSLWTITCVVSGRGESTIIGYSEWAGPFELVKNGVDGQDGQDGKDGADGINGINGTNGIDGKDGADGKDGVDGEDGKSAYEIAVEHGYEGTEEEWLLSMHTELRFQYAIIAGEYDCIRSYGPGQDEAFGYINGVGYGLDAEWSSEAPLNVPEGSYVWLRAKNTSDDVWQYARLTGKGGAAGGFGQPTAVVINSVGVPSVEVSASGPDYAKVFSFVFRNLQGISIADSDIYWAATVSQIQPLPENIVETSIPILSPVYKYLWKKEVVTYTDDSTDTFISLACVYGDTGNTGSGVVLDNVQYGIGTISGVMPETWYDYIVSCPKGNWLWCKMIFSDNTVSYIYSYQGVDAEDFSTEFEYALSSSTQAAPVSGWSDSVTDSWYSGMKIWRREIRHYSDNRVDTMTAFYDSEKTSEFELYHKLKVNISQGTYIGGMQSQNVQRIPIFIDPDRHTGILDLVTTVGLFCYYDTDTSSWIDLSDSISLAIDDPDQIEEYYLKIGLNEVSVCEITGYFVNWDQTTSETRHILTPVVMA